MDQSYRNQFQARTQARDYDPVQYAAGSYNDILWTIEKEQLDKVRQRLMKVKPRIEYLDFATGTGRVLAHMEEWVQGSTGIDISEAMVEHARRNTTKSKVVCGDITSAQAAALSDQYDLITAFRFVLNAEPALRLAVLHALSRRLRDKSSILVFNNHGSLRSLKVCRAMLRGRRDRRHWVTHGNVMKESEARQLANDAGLRIVDVMGCGVLTKRLAGLLPGQMALRVETALSRGPIGRWFGINKMYVAQLMEEL